MPKVYVTATKDFFDRGNQVQRTKDQSFVLRGEYADTLIKEGLVKLDKEKKVEQSSFKEKKAVKPQAKNTKAGPNDMTTVKSVKRK